MENIKWDEPYLDQIPTFIKRAVFLKVSDDYIVQTFMGKRA
jgi:hypothetical protein